MSPKDQENTVYLLTGDIGGTNSRMGLYNVGSGEALVVLTYRNQDHLTQKEDGIFERQIIAPFLKHCWETSDQKDKLVDISKVEIISCLAIAGPVRHNKVSMSNLHNIVIDGTAISSHTYCSNDNDFPYLNLIKRCKIINDFVAQGYGCLTLKPHEVKPLNPKLSFSDLDRTGPKVCVGAGTGLGECFLTPDADGSYTCFPSEGGHVEWAPRSELEIKLWNYLRKKFDYHNRLSVERVVSGKGLANCYEFLAQEFPDKVDKQVNDEFEKAGDMQGKVVAVNAKNGSLCEQAMHIMMGAYGCEVGSAGVKFIPTGGLFVTGGLTPKNIKFIEGKDSPFLKAYNDKGRVKPILENVPVFAIMTEDLGVRGAHKSAQLEYERYYGNGASVSGGSSDNKKTFLYVGAAVAAGMVLGSVLSKKK